MYVVFTSSGKYTGYCVDDDILVGDVDPVPILDRHANTLTLGKYPTWAAFQDGMHDDWEYLGRAGIGERMKAIAKSAVAMLKVNGFVEQPVTDGRGFG